MSAVRRPTAVFLSPVFLQHRTGHHPECPARLETIHRHLEASGLLHRCRLLSDVAAERQQLERVHAGQYIDAVKRFAELGGGRIEADTVVSRESFDVAVRAAGTVCAAVDLVLQSRQDAAAVRQALCLVRPPGHHARPAAAMGFCLFNNVAVAAAHALQHHGLDRVLIVDWDVHHGNGTQEIFYETDRVHFVSVHRYPFYPGTGSAEERGAGPGLGATWNLPLRFGTPRHEYIARFTDIVERAADACRPELVLISAGFDAHHVDPIGSLGLETDDFATLTEIVLRLADRYAGGRIVSTLEGGYNLQALAESVGAHLTALLG